MILTCVMLRTFLTMISYEMTLRHLMPIIIRFYGIVDVIKKSNGRPNTCSDLLLNITSQGFTIPPPTRPPGKSQVAICFLSSTGTTGPPRGRFVRPSVKP